MIHAREAALELIADRGLSQALDYADSMAEAIRTTDEAQAWQYLNLQLTRIVGEVIA